MVDVEAPEDQALVLALQGVAPPSGVEDQGVALEEPGQLLVAGRADPVRTPAGQTVGLHEAGAGPRLDELRVDEVHVGLFDGDLVSDEGRRRVRPAVRTGHTLRLASRVVGGLDPYARGVAGSDRHEWERVSLVRVDGWSGQPSV